MGKDMIDHDRLFKELLSTFFIEFLDLFLPCGHKSSRWVYGITA